MCPVVEPISGGGGGGGGGGRREEGVFQFLRN